MDTRTLVPELFELVIALEVDREVFLVGLLLLRHDYGFSIVACVLCVAQVKKVEDSFASEMMKTERTKAKSRGTLITPAPVKNPHGLVAVLVGLQVHSRGRGGCGRGGRAGERLRI